MPLYDLSYRPLVRPSFLSRSRPYLTPRLQPRERVSGDASPSLAGCESSNGKTMGMRKRSIMRKLVRKPR